MIHVLENGNTSLNHCLLGGFCVKEDVHVLIYVPCTKPEKWCRQKMQMCW